MLANSNCLAIISIDESGCEHLGKQPRFQGLGDHGVAGSRLFDRYCFVNRLRNLAWVKAFSTITDTEVRSVVVG
jgi:hypothetical protein